MGILKKLCFSIFVILLQLSSIHAQNPQLEEANRLFHTADSLFTLERVTTYTDSLAINYFNKAIEGYGQDSLHRQVEAHQKIGNLFQIYDKMDSALLAYRMSLNKAQSLQVPADTLVFYANMYCGDAHHYLENYDSAEFYYLQAESKLPSDIKPQEKLRLYNSVGLLFFHLGNYQQAINYLEKSNSLNQNSAFTEYIIKNNLAISYDMLGRFSTSIPIYRSLLEKQNIPDAVYQNLGKAYVSTQNYDSAKFFLRTAINSNNQYTRQAALNNFADLYHQTNQTDSALLFFRQAINNNQAQSVQSRLNLAASYSGLAKIAFQNQDVIQALEYYQQALISATFDFEEQNYRINPDNVKSGLSLLVLFKIYNGKGNAFRSLYARSNTLSDLEAALINYNEAIQVAQYIQKTYDNDEAKLFLVQQVYPVYEEAISTAHQLYKLTEERQFAEAAFQFSEYSKAAVLSEILEDVDIKSRLKTSDSLIKEEKQHKQRIAKLRLELIELQDSSMLTGLQNDLNESEIALSRTVKLLQKDEKFYRLKYQEDTIDVSHIQNSLLNPKDVLLEYFLGQDSLYSFLLTQEEFLIKSQPIDSSFYQNISDIQGQLYDYQMGQAYAQSKQAYALYQKLIEPFAPKLNQMERLIIIPDGQLNYIPFEMLNDDPTANHYLIYNYAFSYAYSANLLEEAVSSRKAKESNQILAMAPFAGDEEGNIRSNGFSLLFGSKEEVENIGGSIYLENQATKRLFLELVSSYGIIHLATHASISNDDPLQSFIAFYPNEDESSAGYRLYTQELYNLRLDSVKLVVLSACEAGNGQLVKGEGIISLARAFAYAGCPNIITTLWKAQDKSTAMIASAIHEYLKEGYTKDQALRQAKLDYLQSKDVHHLLKTPYYWANFIFIGDTVPVYESSRLWLWWLLAALMIAAGLYWLIKKFILKSQ